MKAGFHTCPCLNPIWPAQRERGWLGVGVGEPEFTVVATPTPTLATAAFPGSLLGGSQLSSMPHLSYPDPT